MSKKTALLLFSVLANLVLISVIVFPIVQKKLNGPDKATYYDNKVSIFRAMPKDEGGVVFVGDSITDYAEWSELFPGIKVKNRGVNGDSTSSVLARIDEIVSNKPSKVFLMIGINNIQSGIPLSKTAADLSKIFDSLDGTPVFVEQVLPINEAKYRDVILRRMPSIHTPTADDVSAINAAIEQVANGRKNITILAHDTLTSNGSLRQEFTDDGLHLNGKGVVARASIIYRYLSN